MAVSYAIAAQLSEPELRYGAIAVYDPKIGTKGQKNYIVAITDGTQYQLGEVIPTQQPQPEKPKVVLCGPSRSGKSCLREALKQAIFQLEGAPYPYVITACPDGEGAWYSAAARRDPQLARRLKQQYKAKFTPDFARKAAGWVRSANTALNLIDVGGARSPENRLIMAQATHAVILSREATEIPPWLEFCQDLGLSVVALLYSHRQGKEDWLQREFPLLTGTMPASIAREPTFPISATSSVWPL